ncbi:MAG: hypothetical protein WCC03_07725 [Candidatus Acidiferrales bacterium]
MTASRTPPLFPGFLLAVGGQYRKVGKSALVADIIQAFPNRHWTAVKITPYAQSGCPVNGPSCDCSPQDHPYAIREETSRSGNSDSSRFLASGAHRALWIETKEHCLQNALPALAAELANVGHALIESDALMRFWKPSLFLMVLDPSNPDFKDSARKNLELADAFVLRSPFDDSDARFQSLAAVAKPRFLQPIGSPLPPDLGQFLSGIISRPRAS